MRFTKGAIWPAILEILEKHDASEDLIEELSSIMKPLASNGNNGDNPPIYDDTGELVEAWCKFHQRYEKADDLVLYKGKSKGYCRAGIAVWTKMRNKLKKLNTASVAALQEGDTDKAIALANDAKDCEANVVYDYDEDWASFKGVKSNDDTE